jgi:hypothetical protein
LECEDLEFASPQKASVSILPWIEEVSIFAQFLAVVLAFHRSHHRAPTMVNDLNPSSVHKGNSVDPMANGSSTREPGAPPRREAFGALGSMHRLAAQPFCGPPEIPEVIAKWRAAADALGRNENEDTPAHLLQQLAQKAILGLQYADKQLLWDASATEGMMSFSMPLPSSIEAMGLLASRSALRCNDNGTLAAQAADALLHLVEHCTALAAEIDSDIAAADFALRLARVAIDNVKPLLQQPSLHAHVLLGDVAARLQVVLVSWGVKLVMMFLTCFRVRHWLEGCLLHAQC